MTTCMISTLVTVSKTNRNYLEKYITNSDRNICNMFIAITVIHLANSIDVVVIINVNNNDDSDGYHDDANTCKLLQH